MFLLHVGLHVVVRHVNSGLSRPPYKHKLYPPLLCMQFDSQWDTHPDNRDQCGFIKPSMRWGDDPGGMGGPLTHGGGARGRAFFPGKKNRGVYSRDWRDTIGAFLAC